MVLIFCKQAKLLFFLPSFSPSLPSSSSPTPLRQYVLLGVSSRQSFVSILSFFPPSLPPSPWHLFSFLPDSVTALALCLCVSSLWSAIIPPPPPPPLHHFCQRYISPHHISDGKEKKRVVREETMKEYFWTPPLGENKRDFILLEVGVHTSSILLHHHPCMKQRSCPLTRARRRATTTTTLKINLSNVKICCCLCFISS